jgi:uncharacterized membrane protein
MVGDPGHPGISSARADVNQDEIQDEINERERNNSANWGKRLGFHHGRTDTRLWVRKPQPWMGWSLNMANPLARALVVLFILLLCLVAASVVFLVIPK